MNERKKSEEDGTIKKRRKVETPNITVEKWYHENERSRLRNSTRIFTGVVEGHGCKSNLRKLLNDGFFPFKQMMINISSFRQEYGKYSPHPRCRKLASIFSIRLFFHTFFCIGLDSRDEMGWEILELPHILSILTSLHIDMSHVTNKLHEKSPVIASF